MPDLEVFDDEIHAYRLNPPSLADLEVLQYLANGWELRAIARAMHLSYGGVRARLRKVVRKLGATNSTHAVAIAMQHNMIPGVEAAA